MVLIFRLQESSQQLGVAFTNNLKLLNFSAHCGRRPELTVQRGTLLEFLSISIVVY